VRNAERSSKANEKQVPEHTQLRLKNGLAVAVGRLFESPKRRLSLFLESNSEVGPVSGSGSQLPQRGGHSGCGKGKVAKHKAPSQLHLTPIAITRTEHPQGNAALCCL
jgi:hypothetical protein